MAAAAEIPGSRERINRLYEDGNIITFFTSRAEAHRAITERWLKSHGFRCHGIIFGKPRGGNYHYIDDKHVRATTFAGKFGNFVYKKMKIQVFE